MPPALYIHMPRDAGESGEGGAGWRGALAAGPAASLSPSWPVVASQPPLSITLFFLPRCRHGGQGGGEYCSSARARHTRGRDPGAAAPRAAALLCRLLAAHPAPAVGGAACPAAQGPLHRCIQRHHWCVAAEGRTAAGAGGCGAGSSSARCSPMSRLRPSPSAPACSLPSLNHCLRIPACAQRTSRILSGAPSAPTSAKSCHKTCSAWG